nr:hypothetical protein [Tanacetum cinerariifolium]
MLNPTPDAGMESIFETTSQMDVQTPTSVAPLPMSAPFLTPSTIATITTTQQAPTLSITAPSTRLQDLPDFGSLFGFDNRLKTLEENFSEFMQMNQFAGAVSSIPEIVQIYMDHRMNEAVKVKEQVKVQVSKILPMIEQTVNEQLEAEVLTRSSNSSKASYVVATDISEMELKNILIKKMKGNKSIQRSNEQRNLYKALVKAYKSDKIILDTYRDTVTLKRRRDDNADKDEEHSVRSDRGSKRRREGKEPESASADDQPIIESSQHPEWFSQQNKPPTLDRDWNKTLPATHRSIQLWISELAKQSDSRSSFNELMDTPPGGARILFGRSLQGYNRSLDWANPKGLQYPHNLLKPLPLILNFRGRHVIPFDHFINNDLEYLHRGASSRKYTTSVTKTKAADYGGANVNSSTVLLSTGRSARDVYSKRRIIAVTELKIVEWRVEDLQLGVKNYQKKLNLTRPDTYRSDLKRKEAYIAYSSLRGFIYQNKDKKNMLMWIDELHKFSDGTLTDVRTALDDPLKGIRMKYLPQSIWRKSDKDRAATMIQAIDKMLKTRRIMRSLERFVGGRLYEGDFRMLQRTI